jgi:hypothetical protein
MTAPRSNSLRRVAATVASVLVLGAVAAACSDDSSDNSNKTTTTTAGRSTTTTAAPTTTTAAPTTTTAAPTTTTAAANVPASGSYVNGSSDVPHYVLQLTANPNGSLSGTMTFIFQDGTSSEVFTFTGQTSGSSATLTPSTGSPINATFAQGQVQLADCTAYLQYATEATQCTFTLS